MRTAPEKLTALADKIAFLSAPLARRPGASMLALQSVEADGLCALLSDVEDDLRKIARDLEGVR